MFIEKRSSIPTLLGVLCLALAEVLFSGSILKAESEALPSTTSRATFQASHQRIEALAAEAEHLFERAMTAEESAIHQLEKEIERSRRVLRALGRELRVNGAEALLEKLSQVETRLGDAWLALNDAPHPLRRETSFAPGRLVPVNAPSDVPANDDCADAIALELGDTAIGDLTLATRDGDASCGSSSHSRDVWFKVSPGAQFVNVDLFGSSYDNVLSVHVGGCPGTRNNEEICNDDRVGLDSAVNFSASLATTYWIRVSSFDDSAGSFELHVGTGGAITGFVAEEGSANPLAAGTVKVRAVSSYETFSAVTGVGGNYNLSGLEADSHWLWTADFPQHLEELHQDVACPEGSCDKTLGTTIAVTSNGSQRIDFVLKEGGAIEGTVIEALTANPVPNVWIEVWNRALDLVGAVMTEADGGYRVAGLPTGEYLVTSESPDHFDELYNDLPCERGVNHHECDTLKGTQVAVADSSTTSGVDFVLDRFGGFSGTITHSRTGEPLSDVTVEIVTGSGAFVSTIHTAGSGAYSIGGLEPGDYVAHASIYSFQGELYNDIPCPGGLGWDCSAEAGTRISVAFNRLTTDIDFALTPLGAISGTVLDATSGAPLPNVTIRAGKEDASRHTATNAAGEFVFSPLHIGYWTVWTDASTHVNETYDDIQCLQCPFWDATLIEVALDTTTSGIDFALTPLGAISGTVTDAVSAEPLPNVLLGAREVDGQIHRSTNSTEDGSFLFPSLNAGDWQIWTESDTHADETYDDILCFQCPAPEGSPVTVEHDITTSGIDFDLTPLGGISGRVTDANTGAPLPSSQVSIDSFDIVASPITAITDADGNYRFENLEAGDWRVWVRSSGYVGEIYDDIVCGRNCPRSRDIVTPVGVILNGTTTDIDFALIPTGAISGTVTERATGDAIGSTWVIVFSADDSHAIWHDTDSSGRYMASQLYPGTYFVATESTSTYEDVLYDNLPLGNDPTAGTPVVVISNTTTHGIDFALPRRGTLKVTVIDQGTGAPVSDQIIKVYEGNGDFLSSHSTDVYGEVVFSDIQSGDYYLQSTEHSSSYWGEIYDDIPCSNGSGDCEPQKGTAIRVAAESSTEVMMALIPMDTSGIAGRVEDSTGEPLPGVTVELWDATGSLFDNKTTLPNGEYLFSGLSAGIYFVSTRERPGSEGQLWRGLPCSAASCDPTSGTPITVGDIAPLSLVSGIDFALDAGYIFGDGFETGDTSLWSSSAGS